MTERGLIAIVALAVPATSLPMPVLAQTEMVPSAVAPAVPSSPLLSQKTATVAGLLFAAALMSDRGVREETQEHRGSTSNSMAKFGNTFGEWRFLVPALSAGYLASEIAGSSDLKRVILHAGAAAALATGVSSGLKYTIGRTRPPVTGEPDEFRPFSGSNSFPSGHTAVAFAIATAIADETDDSWSDVALYGAATLTALSRVNDDRHWTSDVLVGGLIGHLSGRWVSKQMGPVRVTPLGVTAHIEF